LSTCTGTYTSKIFLPVVALPRRTVCTSMGPLIAPGGTENATCVGVIDVIGTT
jgi:hypothetical protein